MWILLRFVSMRLAMKNDCLKEKCVFYRPFAGITTACQGLWNVENVSGSQGYGAAKCRHGEGRWGLLRDADRGQANPPVLTRG